MIGIKVSNFDDDSWVVVATNIVARGFWLKFRFL